MAELWKDLPANPDAYEVSSLGRIRKKTDGKVRMWNPFAQSSPSGETLPLV